MCGCAVVVSPDPVGNQPSRRAGDRLWDIGRVSFLAPAGKSIEDEAGEIGRREYVLVACDERSQCGYPGLGGFWALVVEADRRYRGEAVEAGRADRRNQDEADGDRERHEGTELLGTEIDGL